MSNSNPKIYMDVVIYPWSKCSACLPNLCNCKSPQGESHELLTRNYCHYHDVIMGSIASQITSLTIVYSTVYSGTDQRKHQCSASLAFMRGIYRGPMNSPHEWLVTWKMFPFDGVIMSLYLCHYGKASEQYDSFPLCLMINTKTTSTCGSLK